MSTFERVLWGIGGAFWAAKTAVVWWREEREIKTIQAAHQAEMAHILASGRVR